jgi:hypothetical protein
LEKMMIPKPIGTDLETLSAALNEAESDARVDWLRSLGKKQQAALFAMAEGTQMKVEEVHGGTGSTTVHYGKNSLPMFTQFQKRICNHNGVVQGYNHQSLKWLTGPGHFRVIPHDVPGELLFDYVWAPESVPEGFPPARSNKGGVSSWVYGDLEDVVRKVSDHIAIGRAIIKGKLTTNYFGLCRGEEI